MEDVNWVTKLDGILGEPIKIVQSRWPRRKARRRKPPGEK